MLFQKTLVDLLERVFFRENLGLFGLDAIVMIVPVVEKVRRTVYTNCKNPTYSVMDSPESCVPVLVDIRCITYARSSMRHVANAKRNRPVQ